MLKFLFFVLGVLVVVMLGAAVLLPKCRRTIHQTAQLVAKMLLWVAILGAILAYWQRYV